MPVVKISTYMGYLAVSLTEDEMASWVKSLYSATTANYLLRTSWMVLALLFQHRISEDNLSKISTRKWTFTCLSERNLLTFWHFLESRCPNLKLTDDEVILTLFFVFLSSF